MRLNLWFNVGVFVAITALFAAGILMGSPFVDRMERDLGFNKDISSPYLKH